MITRTCDWKNSFDRGYLFNKIELIDHLFEQRAILRRLARENPRAKLSIVHCFLDLTS